ncbi:MAG: hypothetical protein ROZ09_15185 [Thiobacillus sp.]|uniref:hypothetical protein n=1 Tax=Thiobacillus sp. TaxID=924 RepID=UPI0028952822|nr:hypothetical protein [Thiobacillus sp.]MDT3708164.1 hypothetical protein [Thiobacillus sp.]
MPKMLVTDACIVNYGDDRGGVAEPSGKVVEVTKDTARDLIAANRALYVAKTDDPDKRGLYTASAEMIKAAADMRKAAAAAEKGQDPAGGPTPPAQ